MARPPGISLSLLDRLSPEEGDRITRIRDGLRRDLEDLLNTPNRVRGWSQDLGELNDSLANYGIFDLCTVNLATEERREAVVNQIGQIIRTFEHRLQNLQVFLLPNSDPTDRALRLRIEAQVFVETEIEPMIFNTIVDPATSVVTLTSSAA